MDEPTPTPDEPKHGKARERQRRRRARREAMAKPLSSARSAGRQLRPADAWKMPDIDMRYVRQLVLAIGAVIFVISIIFVVGLFKNEPEGLAPNALWLGQEWTYQTHDDDAVRALIERLHENNIGAVYAHVSELNVDGTWTGRPEQQNRFFEVQADVIAFADQFQRLASDIQLYGTLIVRADLDEDGYRLDSMRVQRAVIDFSAEVVEVLGFDGVLLQVDPFVPDGDENFLTLVRQIRQAIGENALLAVVTPPDWTPLDVAIPTPSSIAPGTAWDARYKQRVALLRIDQLVLRAFDSYMTAGEDYTANDYKDWVAYQVQTYAEMLASVDTDTRLLVAVSTAANIPFAHDVRVENIPSSMVGIRQGLNQAGDAAEMVQGVAIYADWTTDAVEWTQFEDNWLERQ